MKETKNTDHYFRCYSFDALLNIDSLRKTVHMGSKPSNGTLSYDYVHARIDKASKEKAISVLEQYYDQFFDNFDEQYCCAILEGTNKSMNQENYGKTLKGALGGLKNTPLEGINLFKRKVLSHHLKAAQDHDRYFDIIKSSKN